MSPGDRWDSAQLRKQLLRLARSTQQLLSLPPRHASASLRVSAESARWRLKTQLAPGCRRRALRCLSLDQGPVAWPSVCLLLPPTSHRLLNLPCLLEAPTSPLGPAVPPFHSSPGGLPAWRLHKWIRAWASPQPIMGTGIPSVVSGTQSVFPSPHNKLTALLLVISETLRSVS